MSSVEIVPLSTLLRCLDHQEVSELLMVSGRSIGALRNGQLAPLTRMPVTTANIEEMVRNTPLEAAIARNKGLMEAVDLEIAGRNLRCMISRREGTVQLRLGRAPAVAQPALAQQSAGTDAPAPAVATPLPPAHPAPKANALAHDIIEPSRAPDAAGVAGTLAPAPAPAARPMSMAAIVPSVVASDATTSSGPVSPGMAAPLLAPAVATASQAGVDEGMGEVVPPLAQMLAAAWRHNASDVHLMPNAAMKLRRAGALGDVGEVLQPAALEPMLLALLGPQERQQLLLRGYVDKALATEAGRLRLNISRNAQGVKASIRLVPYQVPSLAQLGLPSELDAVARLHQGLVVVSGPTGHGKTTTLAALVALINGHAAHHIITVEDPIEYVHPIGRALLSQRQVGMHTQSFARALKASLREDPDIIVIGELRDRETTEIALSAAETGHLVLTTMNTRSASRAIDRLIDMFPPEDQTQVRTTLAAALKMVVGQKLLPTPNNDARVAAIEMITHCLPLAALIRDNKLFQLPSLMQRGRSAGMLKLDTSLVELVRAGKLAAETARQHAEHAQELERALAVATRTPPGPAPAATRNAG